MGILMSSRRETTSPQALSKRLAAGIEYNSQNAMGIKEEITLAHANEVTGSPLAIRKSSKASPGVFLMAISTSSRLDKLG
jgi:hypothetical protein